MTELPSTAQRGTADLSLSHEDPHAELSADFCGTVRSLFRAGSVADTLQRVVDVAVEVIEGCDLAGIFLIEGDRITTPVCTDPVVIQIDSAQHRCGEGPCLEAIAEGGTVYADELCDDRWPCFGPEAALAGVRSALAIRLSNNGTRGALNCYGHFPRAFGVIDRGKGLLLAGLAEQALAVAEDLEDKERRAENLEAALITRAVIGQAQGILMERERITADQAFSVLRRASSLLNIKLRVVAQSVVDTGDDLDAT